MSDHCSRPFSQACENNRAAILAGLKPLLDAPGDLLEIGSGTGQHAAWLAPQLPHIRWQTSDLPDNLPGISAWLDEVAGLKFPAPLVLDVRGRWPDRQFRYLFSANTFHIMAAPMVQQCIAQGAAHLDANGRFFVYGPFRVSGQFTSDSNRQFDAWLRDRHPQQGIRDLEWVTELMNEAGLTRLSVAPMPANNFLLAFEHTPGFGP